MPELKRVFTSGKMNKDLDERLVPPGEYRDALNIQVSSSEGSDVGAVENILGNTKRNVRSAVGQTVWPSAFGINGTCIGSIRVDQEEKIYWFISGITADAIVEYDQQTNQVAPILVDKNSILNFDSSKLITGINYLEGMLIWTDDNYEPKKINISRFKSGSVDFNTHTEVYGRPFINQDITVIKRNPRGVLGVSMSSTRKVFPETGCGIYPVYTDFNFTDDAGAGFFVVKPVGSSVTFTTDASANWAIGDVISLSASELDDENFEDEFAVRIEVTAKSGTTVTGDIITISSNILDQTYTWTCILEEERPMFEFKFPRFAYRWKYIDGEYSTFSPFTDVVFLPNNFIYKSSDAYNEGMTNNIRSLTLNLQAKLGDTVTLDDVPDDVVEIDILYKESNSTVVYKVDSVPVTQTSYAITSELIGNVISANQLLRPWDNVPRKAKAQEIIGNRIVYGNYVQNYDGPSNVDITTSLTSSSVIPGTPKKSIKTMRSYQLGVVYGDEFGREAPVVTGAGGSVTVNKDLSDNAPRLSAIIESVPPTWASYFKYFIKDTSNQYYNLALDRFYKADSGGVWMSFPSAERSKVSIGDYILLKKEHNSSLPVDKDVRYRVLDISNEAPTDVVVKRTFEVGSKVNKASGSNPMGEDVISFRFDGPTQVQNPKFFEVWNGSVIVRFWKGSDVTDFYEIESGGFTGATTTEYSVTLKEKLGADAAWMDTLAAADEFNVQVYINKYVYKKEYQGKFFVKINRDPYFDEYIINPLTQISGTYNRTFGSIFIEDAHLDDPTDTIKEPSDFAWGEFGTTNEPGKPNQGSASFFISYAPHSSGVSGGNIVTTALTSGKSWFDTGLVPGRFIKFINDPSQTYYEIGNVSTVSQARLGTSFPFGSDDAELVKTITLTEQIVNDPDSWTDADFEIFVKSTDFEDILDSDNVIISSSNPAIFETEPKEAVDLDIYYEVGAAFPINKHGLQNDLDWFNCFGFGNGVESNRIRDDFNAVTIDKGPRASSTLEEPYNEERRGSGMIFSGLYNSTSGVNNLNQFLIAEDITKDLNPTHGTIQKLHARDTDLVVLCEDKIFNVMANKDALYGADGNINVTSSRNVLGQAIPYVGEFGISKNPESFASYGFRAYFTDKNRGSVIRLSRDGITEISRKGMSFYLKAALANATKAIGSYDDYSDCYNLTINGETVSFEETVDGWSSRKSFVAENGVSMNNVYYTFKNGELWSHDNTNRCNFYGVQYPTSIELIYNDSPGRIKNFKTLSYEGSGGWVSPLIYTDSQDAEVPFFKNKEGIWYNYIKGLETTWNNNTQSGSLDPREFSVQGIDYVAEVETQAGNLVKLTFTNAINVSIQGGINLKDVVFIKDSTGHIYSVGDCISVDNEENFIICTLAAGVTISVGDFVFFAKNSQVNTSGIIGYYANVKMEVNSSSFKELFAVNSEVFISS
jgi:hypothetical protein